MKKEQENSKITGLMALLVFAVFAVCVLGVLLTGAGVYKRLVGSGAEDYSRRTAAQYVTTRVRQADRAGSVGLEDFGGQDALVLREKIGGSMYLTRVYCFDGWIRELFTTESGDFSPEDGEKVLEAEGLSFAMEGSSLLAQITLPDGTVQELTLYLRSEGEVLP